MEIDNDDRQTEIPEDRTAYENAACVLTAADTLRPKADGDDNDNGQNDYEGGW